MTRTIADITADIYTPPTTKQLEMKDFVSNRLQNYHGFEPPTLKRNEKITTSVGVMGNIELYLEPVKDTEDSILSAYYYEDGGNTLADCKVKISATMSRGDAAETIDMFVMDMSGEIFAVMKDRAIKNGDCPIIYPNAKGVYSFVFK